MKSLFDFDSFESEKVSLIQVANEAYDHGEPLLNDGEFDLLAETGIDLDPRNFRCKVDHPFLMGSLNKIKTAEDLNRWFRGFPWFALMPKLDGNSIRLSYQDGQLVQAATRGNGTIGNDVTANILRTRVPKTLPEPLTIEVRVEATIQKTHAGKFDKNLRNIAAGLIGAKDPRPDLPLIDCIAIDVVTGRPMSWSDKETLLRRIFPEDLIMPILTIAPGAKDSPDAETFAFAQRIFEEWKASLLYNLDGAVIQGFENLHALLPEQTELLPKDKVALKFGSEEAETQIINIIWSLGQHGKLTPVLEIEPVELDGTTVSRASASNYALVKAAGLGIGALVSVTKSGDIIPKVTKVIQPSIQGLDLPNCPACGFGSVISDTGVDALCRNTECEGTELVKLIKTFELFGIEFVSGSTIENLFLAGYDSLEKIFALSESDIEKLPGFGKKTAEYMVKSLQSIELTEAKVIKSAFLKGIGERKAAPLLNHYGGLVNFLTEVMIEGMASIEGFGPVQTDLINRNVERIADQLHRLKSLGIKILPHEAPAKANKVVCCTGTCSQYPRKELKAVLEGQGFAVVDAVTRETTLLLCEDPSGNSSKLQKARKQGIAIQAYNAFFA